jgi:hypothetical protein
LSSEGGEMLTLYPKNRIPKFIIKCLSD